MKSINPEDIYNAWRREIFKYKKINVRKTKNFKKIKEKNNWIFFEKCSDLINRNNGQIDSELLVKALADHYQGYFDPKLLISRKGLKIYKVYIEILEKQTSEKDIKNSIIRSIKFISLYCKEKNIEDFFNYLNEDTYLIPTILKHFYSGSISLYFLSCIDNLMMILNNFPKDMINEYCPEIEKKYPIYRIRVMNFNSTKKIANNIEEILNNLIKND